MDRTLIPVGARKNTPRTMRPTKKPPESKKRNCLGFVRRFHKAALTVINIPSIATRYDDDDDGI